jgi:ATP-dependent RNA helicase RhlB
MRFDELGLEPSLLSAIQKLKFETCTPIQEICIPHVLEGKDIAGLAQTGTGKTAAFLIPLMDRILKARVVLDNLTEEQKAEVTKRALPEWRAQNFVLIIVPTRELAEQVQNNIIELSVDSGLRGFAIYGGTGYDRQKEAVKNGLEFLVATPGRLIDLYKEHIIDLKQVRAVVFDEADRMFDMGFKDDMTYILSRIPKDRQYLVFSATLNFDVTNTAYQFGADPIEVNVSRDQPKAENVKDEIFQCGHDEKPQFLLSLLKRDNPRQVVIFSNFKMSVERLSRFLSENGIPAMGISSLLSQAQRNRVMEQFKAENEKNILVATDVAARGLDIRGVDLVINYEIPNDAESYVHRIGRTGRAGSEGRAYSLVCDRDVDGLQRVEDYLKHKLPISWLDDAHIIKDFKSMGSDRFHEDRKPGHGDGGPRRFNRSEGRPGGGGRRPGPGGRNGEGRSHEGRHRTENRTENRTDGKSEGREGKPRIDGRQHEGRPRIDGRQDSRPEGRPDNRPDNRPDLREKKSANGRPDHRGPNKRVDNRPDLRLNAKGVDGKPAHPKKDHKPRPAHAHGGKSAAKPALSRTASGKNLSVTQKVSKFFKKIFS